MSIFSQSGARIGPTFFEKFFEIFEKIFSSPSVLPIPTLLNVPYTPPPRPLVEFFGVHLF